MTCVVEADGLGQFADGEVAAEDGEPLEQRDRLLAQEREGAVTSGEDEQGVGDGDEPQQAVDGLPRTDHEAAQPPGFHGLEGGLNGLLTNDKFCWTRHAQLRLTWWRRPLWQR